jgi:hypothetical protein
MMKAAVALLAVAALMAPGTIARYNTAVAQAPAAGGVQMDPDEYQMYSTAIGTADPKAQVPLLEAYLAKYPKSAVKDDVLQRIMVDYYQFDHAKAIDAADKVLQSNPNNLQAYIIEVANRTEAATAMTDPAAKQAALDAAADYAQRGLKLAQGPKPAGITDADWAKLKSYGIGLFYSNIGADLLAKKDATGAIALYKQELASLDPNSLQALQESYSLGDAYYISTPPDYLDCAFYTTRTASLAPDQYKPQFQPLATYCYKRYHGGSDGYDALVALAKANPNPPADLSTTIKPAPTDEDLVKAALAATPDLSQLALEDREFILAHGTPEQADMVFAASKGKTVQIPGALVIESSPTVLKVAVSQDAIQSKTPDFTFNMTPLEEPKAGTTPAAKREMAEYKKKEAAIADATAVGKTVTLQGTYESYTGKPIMIIMSDGSVVLPKATPAAKPSARKPH